MAAVPFVALGIPSAAKLLVLPLRVDISKLQPGQQMTVSGEVPVAGLSHT